MSLLMSTLNLSSILNDPNLVLVDVRSFSKYSNGHIPGAVNLDVFAFHWIDTTKQGIVNFNKQASTLFTAIGAQGKKVVFYDDISGMLAARGTWMLQYMSHPDVVMLDGGITKWHKENLPIETGTNRFRPSEFLGKPVSGLIIGYEEIRDNLKQIKIIDARSPQEYDGVIARAASVGHIPTAVNIDWNLNLSKNGLFKDSAELSHIYRNISKDAPIVTYCQGAYRAAHSFLALKMAGFKDVRVYLGSWGEWGSMLDLPVEESRMSE